MKMWIYSKFSNLSNSEYLRMQLFLKSINLSKLSKYLSLWTTEYISKGSVYLYFFKDEMLKYHKCLGVYT